MSLCCCIGQSVKSKRKERRNPQACREVKNPMTSLKTISECETEEENIEDRIDTIDLDAIEKVDLKISQEKLDQISSEVSDNVIFPGKVGKELEEVPTVVSLSDPKEPGGFEGDGSESPSDMMTSPGRRDKSGRKRFQKMCVDIGMDYCDDDDEKQQLFDNSDQQDNKTDSFLLRRKSKTNLMAEKSGSSPDLTATSLNDDDKTEGEKYKMEGPESSQENDTVLASDGKVETTPKESKQFHHIWNVEANFKPREPMAREEIIESVSGPNTPMKFDDSLSPRKTPKKSKIRFTFDNPGTWYDYYSLLPQIEFKRTLQQHGKNMDDIVEYAPPSVTNWGTQNYKFKPTVPGKTKVPPGFQTLSNR